MTLSQLEEDGYRVVLTWSRMCNGARKYMAMLEATTDDPELYDVALVYSHDGREYAEPVGIR